MDKGGGGALPVNVLAQSKGSGVGLVSKSLAAKDGLAEGQLPVQLATPEQVGTFSRHLTPECVTAALNPSVGIQCAIKGTFRFHFKAGHRELGRCSIGI